MKSLWALAVLAACVDSGPGPQGKQVERKYVAENLLTAVPPDVQHVDVDLGGRVQYVGSTIDREPVIPGQAVKLASYWRVVIPPGPGWRVFVQVRGAPSTADFMNLEPSDMELGHPVATWLPGQIIRDEHSFVLRPDWKSKTATFYVGLIRDGGHDDESRMPASGPGTSQDAAVARTVDVDLSKAPPPPGTIYIPRAAGAITIDGVANDPGWAGAVQSPEFVTAEGSTDPNGRTTAKLTYDDQYLYAFVSVLDNDIVAPYTKHDEPLYKADAIEIFIDADGNRRGYVELQVNPNNATFDKWWPGTRAEPGDESWDSGMQSAVKLRGTTAPNDQDIGWDVELAIPWAAVKGRDANMRVRLPPEIGDRWRMNIVRTDQKTGGKNQAEGGASSWNRISSSDFHALDRMLVAVFADHAGSIVPKPADAPLPAPVGSAGSGSAGSAGVTARP
ncbi:MAG TPA: carbohydrate-binding family 9-like protein [Kofleriaceae bacterium]|jgi:hypothetical protein